ncbi:MAG: hypothetical protein JWP69_1835 [Flaviaesturariibacter sp.]|nr:hypothetical protein [Flaviaesturariibacter sp.]
MRLIFSLFISFIFLSSCKEDKKPVPKSQDEEVAANITRLIATAQDGDLIVRLNDDILSTQLRFFNEVDKSFSHSGIVVTKNGQKTVVNILPGNATSNPMIYTPLDTFVDPKTNISCALFRYDITPSEKSKFLQNINALSTQKIYFDSTINIATDDSLYCSEMIYKTLQNATGHRMSFHLAPIPQKMQKTTYKFYRGRLSEDTIAARRIIFIDNLYRIPECKELMRFQLKYFPGS